MLNSLYMQEAKYLKSGRLISACGSILLALFLFLPVAYADTQGPTGTIVINAGDASTDDPQVTLTLSATDDSGVVEEMQFADGDYNFSNPEPYATSKTWTLSAGDGNKTVQVMYRDQANNWSVIYEDTIALNTTPPDTVPPTGSVLINSGDENTEGPQVELTVNASDNLGNVAYMQFANEDFVFDPVESYTSTKQWALSSGNGQKTVWVMFQDEAGNWSQAYGDTIQMGPPPDTEPPTGSIVIDGGAADTNAQQVTLTVSASDNSGNIAEMQFSNEDFVFSPGEPFNTTKTWTLSAGYGTKTVYVMFRDDAGNWSQAYSGEIIWNAPPPDTEPPTGSVLINGNAASTTDPLVTLSVSASDNSGTIAYMQFANEDFTFAPVEPYATSKTWELSSFGGTRTVYVMFQDEAGNWSEAYSDSIELDLPPDVDAPTGSISINDGASNTSTTTVTLKVEAVDDTGIVQWIQFANEDMVFSDPEPFTGNGNFPPVMEKTWTLSSWGGEKTVYAMFSDQTGNWSEAYFDHITLSPPPEDTQGPTGTVVIDGGAASTAQTEVTLTINATDDQGPVELMQIANEDFVFSQPEPYSTTKTWNLKPFGGTRTVHIMFRDAAGNWSQAFSDTIDLTGFPSDNAPPTGSLTINNGALSTTDELVALSVSATDDFGPVQYMQFSNEDFVYSSPEPFNTVKTWTLSPGDGLKKVYVMFQDFSGNWSQAYSDGIVLNPPPDDTEAPTGTVLINDGNAETTSQTVSLTINATDDSGSVLEMQFANGDYNFSPPEPYNSTKEWTLSPGNGLKTVQVMFRDAANNWSDIYEDTISLNVNPITIQSMNPSTGGVVFVDKTITITASATHAHALPLEYLVELDGVALGTWSGTLSQPWTPAAQDAGVHTLKVRVRDTQNVEAEQVSDVMVGFVPLHP